MKLKNVFNSMGFAGRYGKLGNVLDGITEDIKDMADNITEMQEDAATLSALVNKLKAVATVTISFDTDEGSTIDAQTIAFGAKATLPTAPTKEGYTFIGWTLDGAEFDFDTAVEANITLVADWELITYSVTYDGNGADSGEPPVDETLYDHINNEVTLLGAGTLVKDGYTFLGWSLDKTDAIPMYVEGAKMQGLDEDKTFYAIWELDES